MDTPIHTATNIPNTISHGLSFAVRLTSMGPFHSGSYSIFVPAKTWSNKYGTQTLYDIK